MATTVLLGQYYPINNNYLYGYIFMYAPASAMRNTAVVGVIWGTG